MAKKARSKFRKAGRGHNIIGTQRRFVLLKDRYLSDIENSDNAARVLAIVGGRAGTKAYDRARKLGLPQIYTYKDQVFEMYPNGQLKKISSAETREVDSYYIKYQKGTVLHAK